MLARRLSATLGLSLGLALALASASLAAGPARAADSYEVKTAEVKATVGAKGTTSVTVVPKNGWHLNEEFPIALKLAPGAGVTVDKNKLGRPDLAESTKERARFDVAFTASEPGKKTIDAEANFAVCQQDACKPVKEKVVLSLDVAAEEKPAAKGKGKKKP